MVTSASAYGESGAYISATPVSRTHRSSEGRASRTTVGLGPALLKLVDLQAMLEGTNRAALTRKAAHFYLDQAAGRQSAIATVTARQMTVDEVRDAMNFPGEPGKRVTVQLDPATAAVLQDQADLEHTNVGALTRKALESYIKANNGSPESVEAMRSLVGAAGGR